LTTTHTLEQSNVEGSRSWGDSAVRFAAGMASPGFLRGDLAALRRMNPDRPDAAAFWRLLAQEDLLGPPSLEAKWSLILHGIALMTLTASGDAVHRSAHEGQLPVGRALFQGGDPQRGVGFYSETRLNRLLTARGPMLRTLLCRMFRMLASAGVSFNWREMARFVLSDGYDEAAVEGSRRRMARDYYQAQRRSAQFEAQIDQIR
jgi:CRISPR type I-E-associated protein CasB/Cse2